MPEKADGFPSGYYVSKNGQPFHALANPHGGQMSQETLDAIAAVADAAARMVNTVCPVCGNTYGHGLTTRARPARTDHDKRSGAGYVCICGWQSHAFDPAEEYTYFAQFKGDE